MDDDAEATRDGKGMGKGEGRGTRSKVKMPKELVGMHSKGDKGNRLCFG